jgi:hypothetical protein
VIIIDIINMKRYRNLIQPFLAGSTKHKSLLVTIPAYIVKEYALDPSTWLSISYNEDEIRLQYVDIKKKELDDD